MMPSKSVPIARVLFVIILLFLFTMMEAVHCNSASICGAGFAIIFSATVLPLLWIISNVICWVLFFKSKQDLKDHISRIPLYLQTVISVALAIYAMFGLALITSNH
jgi:hypothetical protein